MVEPADAVDFVLRNLAAVKVAIVPQVVQSQLDFCTECNPDFQFVGARKCSAHCVPHCVCSHNLHYFLIFVKYFCRIFSKKIKIYIKLVYRCTDFNLYVIKT